MKILLIRFSSIGDIVLTTPVIRCVQQQLGAAVHYLTKPQFKDVLVGNPYIEKLHLLDENIFDTIATLRKEKFDYVLDLHHNQRSFLVMQLLFAKSKSLNKQNIEKWLMVNMKVNKLLPVHIVDRYLDVAKPLGVKHDQIGLDYFIPGSEEVQKNELPETHRNGYIGWVLAATHNTKRFPAEKVIHACKKIEKPIILLGGRKEIQEGEEIASASGSHVYNACGKFSINQSASIVKQATHIITNDTGLMHIAAAFQKPIISLWGNTIPEFGMYPYYGNAGNKAEILEVHGLKCRPCSKIGFAKCPKGHFKCMNLIDENKIVELIAR